jgi:tetratricopeptide (TPR) repeat protein
MFEEDYIMMGDDAVKAGDFKNAISYYVMATVGKPNSIDLLFKLAVPYNNLKDYDKGIECFQKILELDSTNSGACFLMGLSYFFKKEYDKAIEYYRKVIDLKLEIGREKKGELYFQLAKAYFCKGNSDGLVHHSLMMAGCCGHKEAHELYSKMDPRRLFS